MKFSIDTNIGNWLAKHWNHPIGVSKYFFMKIRNSFMSDLGCHYTFIIRDCFCFLFQWNCLEIIICIESYLFVRYCPTPPLHIFDNTNFEVTNIICILSILTYSISFHLYYHKWLHCTITYHEALCCTVYIGVINHIRVFFICGIITFISPIIHLPQWTCFLIFTLMIYFCKWILDYNVFLLFKELLFFLNNWFCN